MLFGGEVSSPDDFVLTNDTWLYRMDTQVMEHIPVQGARAYAIGTQFMELLLVPAQPPHVPHLRI